MSNFSIFEVKSYNLFIYNYMHDENYADNAILRFHFHISGGFEVIGNCPRATNDYMLYTC